MGKVIQLRTRNEGIIMSPTKNKPRINNESDNLIQIAKVIIYFASNSSKKLFKTKLHKLMFYAQFVYYKRYKKKLFNADFICNYYGPTLENLDTYLNILQSAKLLKCENTCYGTTISSKVNLEQNSYTEEEEEVLSEVNNKFESFNATRISKYSHEEKLWDEDKIGQKIPIEQAEELLEF